MNIEVGTKLCKISTGTPYTVDEILRKGTACVLVDESGGIMLKTFTEIERDFADVGLKEENRVKCVCDIFFSPYTPPSYVGKSIDISELKTFTNEPETYKWHEALLMAASGTPMHSVGSPLYIKLEEFKVVWADKETNETTEVIVVANGFWDNCWVPYTPKKMVVDWTKVPVDTDVFIGCDKDGTRHGRKFKAFVDGKVFVNSEKEDKLYSWEFTELAEPNDDYMKEVE